MKQMRLKNTFLKCKAAIIGDMAGGRIFYLESQKISQRRCCDGGDEFEYTSVMIKTAVH